MFRRYLRFLALVLVAGLLSSSQCYAACPVCTAPSAHTSGCHHHPAKGDDFGKACPHQNSDFFTPEPGVDLAKPAATQCVTIAGLLFVPHFRDVEIQPTAEILQSLERHVPQGTSALALLSTFRV